MYTIGLSSFHKQVNDYYHVIDLTMLSIIFFIKSINWRFLSEKCTFFMLSNKFNYSLHLNIIILKNISTLTMFQFSFPFFLFALNCIDVMRVKKVRSYEWRGRERERDGDKKELLSLISWWRLSFLAVLGQISPRILSLSLDHVFLSRCLKAISCVQ